MSLPAIRDYLRSASTADVHRIAAALLPELAAGAAPASPAGTGDAATASAGSPSAAPPLPPNERPVAVNDAWYRLTLVPGLEIHLHVNASAEVQALARNVIERFRS
jgi:hypothetical protein